MQTLQVTPQGEIRVAAIMRDRSEVPQGIRPPAVVVQGFRERQSLSEIPLGFLGITLVECRGTEIVEQRDLTPAIAIRSCRIERAAT